MKRFPFKKPASLVEHSSGPIKGVGGLYFSAHCKLGLTGNLKMGGGRRLRVQSRISPVLNQNSNRSYWNILMAEKTHFVSIDFKLDFWETSMDSFILHCTALFTNKVRIAKLFSAAIKKLVVLACLYKQTFTHFGKIYFKFVI
jgi:hypothetical protein